PSPCPPASALRGRGHGKSEGKRERDETRRDETREDPALDCEQSSRITLSAPRSHRLAGTGSGTGTRTGILGTRRTRPRARPGARARAQECWRLEDPRCRARLHQINDETAPLAALFVLGRGARRSGHRDRQLNHGLPLAPPSLFLLTPFNLV